MAKEYSDETLIEKIINEKSPNNKMVFTTKINEENHFVVYSYIQSLDWYIVGVVPVGSIL